MPWASIVNEGYKSLVDALPLSVLIKDVAGRRVFANRCYLEQHGKSLEEICSKTDADLFPPELAVKYAQDDRQVMESGRASHEVERYALPGQGETWIERIKSPIYDEDGRLLGVHIVFWDVTARIRTEEAFEREQFLLHTLLDNIPDSIYFKDRESRFLRISRSMAEKFGVADAAALIGKTDADIFTSEHALQARHDELRVMDSGQPLVARVERETWPDRPDTWCSSTKLPLRDSSGAVVGTFGISRDVTALKRSEDELREARDAANAANKAKSAFLANMSHEIRTPMNGIIGMAELLDDTRLTSDQREYLEMIQQSAHSLLSLLNDILDFSKIEAGRLELESIAFNLPECVGRTMQTLTRRAGEKGLELACRIAPEVPDWVEGDPVRLRQIIVNLVGNGIKFTERGEVVVEANLESRDNGRLCVHFTVRDTGMGIPAAQQETIFEAFRQADVSTTRQFGGTGLGLTISAQLARLMGGELWLESQSGVGSVFHFVVEFGAAAEQPAVGRIQHAQLQDVPVLVVDDNATNRRILDEMLKSWGLAPVIAEGGVAALTMLQRAANGGQPIPLVLLDCMMPGMDGFALAELIRGNPTLASAVLIMISSATRPGDSDRCRQLGIVRHMTKPVIKSDLLDSILEVLEGRDVSGKLRPVRPTAPTARPLSVLLVEDGLVNQRVAIGLLRRAGHEVTVASNGREAVDAVRRQPFDIVLMDVQMPEMDGYEATQAIRESERDSGRRLPIIAMTAAAMKGDRERCLEAGMDDYIAKPIDADTLYRLIAEYTHRPDLPPIAEPSFIGLRRPCAPSCVDFAAALRAVPGGPDVMRELCEAFLAECPRLLGDAQRGLESGDARAAQRAIHTLKSSARILAASRLADLADELERLAKQKELDRIAAGLGPLQDAATDVCDALSGWLSAR